MPEKKASPIGTRRSRGANKRRGHGTSETDRPPIQGIVGRESGQVRLTVCRDSTKATLEPLVLAATRKGAIINTYEWAAYIGLAWRRRQHVTVNHSQREYARDDDGDGVREVHTNTQEGLWTGLHNFLRPFRGVNKEYLIPYVAVFAWAHKLKRVTTEFLQTMLVSTFSLKPT